MSEQPVSHINEVASSCPLVSLASAHTEGWRPPTEYTIVHMSSAPSWQGVLLLRLWLVNAPVLLSSPLTRRFQRGLSRSPRSLSGSSTPPSGPGETATPAGRRGYTKLSVNSTVRSRMPSDSRVVLLADVTRPLWLVAFKMHAWKSNWKKGI